MSKMPTEIINNNACFSESDALEALDCLYTIVVDPQAVYSNIDVIDRLTKTIRTALTQSAEKDAVIRDLAEELKGYQAWLGVVRATCICPDTRAGAHNACRSITQTLTKHTEAIKRAEKED